MIKPFIFSRIPEIYFGSGSNSRLPALITKYGSRLALVTGKKSFLQGKISEILLEELQKEQVQHQLVTIPDEPGPEMIDKTVTELRQFRPEIVVSIGGGSVMDAGKAISAMLTVRGTVTEYLEDVGTKQHPGTKVPFIAVPTTSGTGSEATKNAVISRTGRDGFKKSLRHDNFVPDIALVDPSLTLNCPPDITAASGMDCFSQLTEAFLSTKANAYTDSLALAGLKAVKSSLRKSYENGKDIEGRSGMAFAALTSGICLANAGLGVVHGFASSVGGLYKIPHGLICGALMAVSNEITLKKLRETGANPAAEKKYAMLGKIFLDEENKSDNYNADGFISYLNELTVILGLSLKDKGIKQQDLKEIYGKTGMKNNPVQLETSDLEIILGRIPVS